MSNDYNKQTNKTPAMVITSIKQVSRNPYGLGKWMGKTKLGDSNKIQNWICSYVSVVVKRKWNWMDPATHEIAVRFWLTKGKGPVLSRMPSNSIWEQLAELEKILQKDNRKQLKPLRISGISKRHAFSRDRDSLKKIFRSRT